MIAGYITIDELALLTGFSKSCLKEMIKDGMKGHQIEFYEVERSQPLLYNLKEVEEWLKIHIY